MTEPSPPSEPRLTPEQRRVVAVLAGLAALLLVVLLVALIVRDDPDDSIVADATTTTAAEETTTTVDLRTSTTAAPTTTTAAGAATTTTTAAPKPVVDGRGAVLVAPGSAVRREMTANECGTLGDDDWAVECGLFTGKGGVEMAWLVEQKEEAFRAFVLRRAQGRQWNVVLEARDEAAARFADVNVRVADVSGDRAAEAVFGFRLVGGAEVLAVDVVEGPGRVVVHRDSPKGSARVSSGQLDLWEAAAGGRYDHLTIRFVDGAWRIVANVKVAAGDVPPSQL